MPAIAAAHMGMFLKAVAAFIGLGVAAMTAVTVLGFPNDYLTGPTETPLFPPVHPVTVEFGPNSSPASCPTCIFVDSNDVLIDYYGRPIDIHAGLREIPTPTLPLKISYAAPPISHLKPTSTPPSTPKAVLHPEASVDELVASLLPKPLIPQPGASTQSASAGSLSWLSVISWYFFPLQNFIFYLINHTIGCANLSPAWEFAWLIACRLACATFARAVVASYQHRRKKGESLAKLGLSLAIARPATAANALLQKLIAIVLGNLQDPATLVSAIHQALIEYIKVEKVMDASWVESQKQRVFDEAKRRIKETLAREKATLRRTANREFKRWKKAHEDELNAKVEESGAAGNNAIKDGSEQDHHDDEGFDDGVCFNKRASEGKNGVEDTSEDVHRGVPESARKASDVPESDVLEGTKGRISWHRWQVSYLRAGHGTPEDPDAKPYSDIPSPDNVEETSDAALARQLQEEELTVWREGCILYHERRVADLQMQLANLDPHPLP